MNYSTAILLANSAVQVILASYDRDPDGKPLPGTIKPYKTLDERLKVGDFVVVPTDTRHRMTVVRVEEVDHDLDLDYAHELQWVIDRVDMAAFEKIKAGEAEAIAAVKSAEKKARRDAMAEKLKADNPAFANLGKVGAPALAAPAAPDVDPLPEAPTGVNPADFDGF
jgi:hypothetical protein